MVLSITFIPDESKNILTNFCTINLPLLLIMFPIIYKNAICSHQITKWHNIVDDDNKDNQDKDIFDTRKMIVFVLIAIHKNIVIVVTKC